MVKSRKTKLSSVVSLRLGYAMTTEIEEDYNVTLSKRIVQDFAVGKYWTKKEKLQNSLVEVLGNLMAYTKNFAVSFVLRHLWEMKTVEIEEPHHLVNHLICALSHLRCTTPI